MEHVPPKCLFPEIKDSLGIDFRKNLIKVPSCEIHNTSKTKDDEYLMLVLSRIYTNNVAGIVHGFTKVERALDRKKEGFYDSLLKNKRIVEKELRGEKMKIQFGDPDFNRLYRCFVYIAYGLYYYKYKKRFRGKVKCTIGFIDYYDENLQEIVNSVFHCANTDGLAMEIEGENPAIFKYQFHQKDQLGLIGMRMTFYGSSEVFVSFVPEDFEKDNLDSELIKSGIPHILNINGKNFGFNME